MGNRPGRSAKLLTLAFNVRTQLYEINEGGITYGMELEMTRELKKYFSNNTMNSMSDWYNSLSKLDRSKVVRTGHVEIKPDDSFFPDPEFE